MQWQDWVIAVGNWIFSAALLPTILAKEKPALSTSLTTGSVLIVFAYTFATLSLWAGAASSGLTGTLWLFLAYQKYRQLKK